VSYCNNSISGCWDASTLIQCLSCFASTGWRCRWSWTTATICPLVVFVVASALLPFGLSWSSWPLLPTICLVCNAQCYLSECSVVAALVCFVLVEEDTPPLPTPRHLTTFLLCSLHSQVCLGCSTRSYLVECSVVAALVCFVLVEEDTPPLPTPRHLTLVFRCSSLFTFKGTVIQFLPKGINCTVLRCAIQFLPKGIN